MRSPVRVAVVGCGDVAARSYAAALTRLQPIAQVVALCDRDAGRARDVRDRFFPSRDVATRADVAQTLERDDPDAVVNLTPPREHGAVNAAALRAAKHVFSEKPLALDLAEADELIRLAEQHGVVFACAPAVAATPKFQHVQRLLESRAVGRPLLATAQFGTLGPAGWDGYTSDPREAYAQTTGPLVDTGIYLLHALTGLLGPVRVVHATAAILVPTRTIVAGPSAGLSFAVAGEDTILLHLEFEHGVLAQVLSSSVVVASMAPRLEVFCAEGSISVDARGWWSASAPVSVFRRKDPGWKVEPTRRDPADDDVVHDHMLETGVSHFLECVEGRSENRLLATEARHVLEVIHAARIAASSGRAVELPLRKPVEPPVVNAS